MGEYDIKNIQYSESKDVKLDGTIEKFTEEQQNMILQTSNQIKSDCETGSSHQDSMIECKNEIMKSIAISEQQDNPRKNTSYSEIKTIKK